MGTYVLHFAHSLFYRPLISYFNHRHYFHHHHHHHHHHHLLKALGFYKNLILTQTFVMGLKIISNYMYMTLILNVFKILILLYN